MALFSHRKGIRPARKALQRESIDDDLRNMLWSGLKIAIWDHWIGTFEEARAVESIVREIWINYFKRPVDAIPAFDGNNAPPAYMIIRQHFLAGEWWQVYDFIEFVVKVAPEQWAQRLREISNSFLESENAAYRIIDDQIVEITDEHEIEAIETALDKDVELSREHLSRALELLSDRKQPDYRNSIKESISAVESVCQLLTGMPKATLGDCIRALKTKESLHSAFEQALLKLYGYTSDEGGIRHALTEDSVCPSYADAKFMLVTSAAFVNFILAKAAELEIDMEE